MDGKGAGATDSPLLPSPADQGRGSPRATSASLQPGTAGGTGQRGSGRFKSLCPPPPPQGAPAAGSSLHRELGRAGDEGNQWAISPPLSGTPASCLPLGTSLSPGAGARSGGNHSLRPKSWPLAGIQYSQPCRKHSGGGGTKDLDLPLLLSRHHCGRGVLLCHCSPLGAAPDYLPTTSLSWECLSLSTIFVLFFISYEAQSSLPFPWSFIAFCFWGTSVGAFYLNFVDLSFSNRLSILSCSIEKRKVERSSGTFSLSLSPRIPLVVTFPSCLCTLLIAFYLKY